MYVGILLYINMSLPVFLCNIIKTKKKEGNIDKTQIVGSFLGIDEIAGNLRQILDIFCGDIDPHPLVVTLEETVL